MNAPEECAIAAQAGFHRSQAWRIPCHAVAPEQLRSLFVAKERLDRIMEWCEKHNAADCKCNQCDSLRMLVNYAKTGDDKHL